MRKALLLLFVVACKKESAATTLAETLAPSSSTPPAHSMDVTIAAHMPTVDEELITLTQRWSDTLTRHDADGLRDVYGARVTLYGSTLDREAAIAGKKAALTGDYAQAIASILIVRSNPERPAAIFDKTWTTHGKTSSVRGSLHFGQEASRWVVVEETDAKTETMLADNSCLALAHKVVLSTDDAAVYRTAPYGTMYVCGPPDCDAFQIAAIRIGHDLERLATYDVDPKKGVVTHAGVALNADPKVIAQLKVACAREGELPSARTKDDE